MPVSTASAVWNGSIGDGSGTMTMANYEGPFSVPSRFQDGEGSTPEELLAAAHAGCFSMQLSALLTRGGNTPDRIETSADVQIDKLEDGYRLPGEEAVSGEFAIVAGLVRDIRPAGANLAVIRTGVGAAQRVAVFLDRSGWREIIGTVSGDDTIFVASDSERSAKKLETKFKELSNEMESL